MKTRRYPVIGKALLLATVLWPADLSARTLINYLIREQIAEGIAHNVAGIVSSGTELAKMTVDYNAEMKRIREKYWANYPDGPNIEEATREFYTMLNQKDIHFLMLHFSGNGLMMSTLHDVTGGAGSSIHPETRADFHKWTGVVAKGFGAKNPTGTNPSGGALFATEPEVGNRIQTLILRGEREKLKALYINALEDAVMEYWTYRKARDRAEYKIAGREADYIAILPEIERLGPPTFKTPEADMKQSNEDYYMAMLKEWHYRLHFYGRPVETESEKQVAKYLDKEIAKIYTETTAEFGKERLGRAVEQIRLEPKGATGTMRGDVAKKYGKNRHDALNMLLEETAGDRQLLLLRSGRVSEYDRAKTELDTQVAKHGEAAVLKCAEYLRKDRSLRLSDLLSTDLAERTLRDAKYTGKAVLFVDSEQLLQTILRDAQVKALLDQVCTKPIVIRSALQLPAEVAKKLKGASLALLDSEGGVLFANAGDPAPLTHGLKLQRALSSLKTNPRQCIRELNALEGVPGGLAEYRIGLIYSKGGNWMMPEPKTAFTYFTAAMKLGNSDAECALGMYYFKGIGDVRVDHGKAFSHFSNAAGHGSGDNAQALYFLGVCYEEGIGTQKNAQRAQYLYASAEARGFSPKQNKP